MKRWVALGMFVGLVGCTSENPSLIVERQAVPLDQATDAGWTRGSVILAGDAGAFTFPQPLSLRFTIVDDAAAAMPATQLISRGKVAIYGSGQLAVTAEPVCQPMSCTAELTIMEAGSSMVAIDADGPSGGERNCFYYAVVDATTDTDALRAELETQQRDCRFAN
jgi:hypothetical protein